MLDLNDVALFVQVVQAGSFAEAARRLGMPANTASRRVQGLEQHLGARLMQRSTRKLTLTDAGQRFYAQSAEQVEALRESARALVDGNQLPSGKVRVAAPADFFNWFAVEWMAEFLELHPKVQLDFVLSDAQADLLAEGIDIAFRAGTLHEPNLVARPIGKSRAFLVASPRYLLARGTPESLASLSQHDCLVWSTRSGTSSWRLDGPDGEVRVEIGGRFGANTAHALMRAAVAGLGIALLPSTMTRGPVDAGELVQVLPAYGRNGIGIHFVYLSRQVPRAVSVFMDFTIAKMRAHGIEETC
ncbi:MAG: LysR family transcriptional regulator, transcriptional activator AphB [Rhizobacter sp.]|nr:LysR family transcriptional regulator, transcriptional activator AphB [Rhizobacter sp.]